MWEQGYGQLQYPGVEYVCWHLTGKKPAGRKR
jgi:hypothetical protein